MPDKLNHVDYRWYVVRTKRHQESKLVELFWKSKRSRPRISLKFTRPPHHGDMCIRTATINRSRCSRHRVRTRYADALMNFMKEHSLDAGMQYERKNEKGERTRMCVIPESQMRAFRDYNENYADKVIVLEHPYSDYAFNTKTGEPNRDCTCHRRSACRLRRGYICRFGMKNDWCFRYRVLNRAAGSRSPVPRHGTCAWFACTIWRETGSPSEPRKDVPWICL